MKGSLADFLEKAPFIAILRGIRPCEIDAIAQAVMEGGIGIIEIPLNSPDPLESIGRLVKKAGDRALVGAGTVLCPRQVDDIHSVGGRLVVSPDANPLVIARALELGMEVVPGIRTATEAFTAIRAGAGYLKMFPVVEATIPELKALKSVLPPEIRLLAVGGVATQTIPALVSAGADGFGVGSALYRPGDVAGAVAMNAAGLLSAWKSTR